MNPQYILIWQGEEIDTANDYTEAQYLKGEYNAAYGGGVSVKRGRV
jgi:hypothetical protein